MISKVQLRVCLKKFFKAVRLLLSQHTENGNQIEETLPLLPSLPTLLFLPEK